MSPKKSPNRVLADYLRRRVQHLLCCDHEIQSKVQNEQMALCQKIDAGELNRTDPSVGKMIFHLEYVIGNTFRYTLLIGVCSFLEESLKAISKYLIPDYQAKWKLKKTEKGNWLRKHISLLSDHAGLDVAPIQTHLDTFHDLITMRNCIVHAWGKVAEATDPSAVTDASNRVGSAVISKDGYLVLGDQVLPEAIWAAESIVDAILMEKLSVSIT